VQVTIRTAADLKAYSKALRAHADGKELGKNLTRELRAVAQPFVPRVRQAWLSAPSSGHGTATRARRGQPDLRTLLAKATRVEVRRTGKLAGVRIRTDGRKMPDRMKALPGYVEGIRRRPWRHPVFGDQGTWTQQDPFPRFYDAVQPAFDQAWQATQRVLDQALNEIARAR
jgi:hypothetical protein